MENKIVKIPPKFQLTEKKQIKSNSSYNVLLALKADYQLNQSLKYNEFTEDVEIVNEMTLGKTTFQIGEMPSNFESVLAIYFEKELDVVFTPIALKNGLETFFTEKKYNPVKIYMEKCKKSWDKQTRIAHLFRDYLGADDSELIEKIALIFFVAAVKKVYEPDFKFDYVLDLVGGQGVGKTSILQKIGGDWYSDSITDFSNKDNFETMIRSLIVNDDEMVASKKMGFAELKAFVTKTRLRFRKAYARRAQEYPKKFILARTTNEIAYLRDKTGERRFLPIMVNAKNQKKHPMNLAEEDVVQLWGEAMILYEGGYPTIFNKEEEAELEQYRESFMYVDEIEDLLDDFLEMPIPRDWESMDMILKQSYTQNYINGRSVQQTGFKLEKVSTRDIVQILFNQDVARGKLSRKISYIMQNNKHWEAKVFKQNDKTVRGYIRKK